MWAFPLIINCSSLSLKAAHLLLLLLLLPTRSSACFRKSAEEDEDDAATSAVKKDEDDPDADDGENDTDDVDVRDVRYKLEKLRIIVFDSFNFWGVQLLLPLPPSPNLLQSERCFQNDGSDRSTFCSGAGGVI